MSKNFLKTAFLIGGIGIFSSLSAQPNRPTNGPRNEISNVYVFTHANIFISPEKSVKDGMLMVVDGKVSQVGTDFSIPKGAIVTDLGGKYIWPSFIDAWSNYGIEKPRREGNNRQGQQHTPERPGAYNANDAIKADQRAAELFRVNAQTAEKLRKSGFGLSASFISDGIARGTSCVVFLGAETENSMLLKSDVANHFSLDKGTSTQSYPEAHMGAIALLRQTFSDANWYQNTKPGFTDLSLTALNQNQALPKFFESRMRYDILRGAALGKEFGYSFIFKGLGDEYQYVNALKQLGAQVILPLNFPDAMDVEDPIDAANVNLDDMMHWEMAPANPAILYAAGVPIAFTSAGLRNTDDFIPNIRLAINYGLPFIEAMRALTVTPAKMLRVDAEVGTLDMGKWANFIITSDSVFAEGNSYREHWVKGKRYIINYPDSLPKSGFFTFKTKDLTRKLEITTSGDRMSGKLWLKDSVSVPFNFNLNNGNAYASFDGKDNWKGQVRFNGWATASGFSGTLTLPDGSSQSVSITRDSLKTDKPASAAKKLQPFDWKSKMRYPYMEYGWKELPKQETVVIRNATVWTMTADSVMANTDVLIVNGKISKIGSKLQAPAGCREIDGTGYHLTPGLIDEHSHIAVSGGVNEGTRSVTSEVDIDDVLNASDINIYRQLAGGITTSHLLHGSANTIGGQTALIKLRWGRIPNELRFEGADPFIKFALGENVKQTNWGPDFKDRFPQTRMGVEQTLIDAFVRAKAYQAEMSKWRASGMKGPEPRKDYTLETLSRILQQKQFITCHSYVQSEINMLMHTADSMGFKVNTFTHILEGYKVADKLKAHGAYASTFSDWWAYKYEVIDAIPYNAAIMTKAGVITAINSDDAEMARRLNQEAAKTIKYGGMTPVQALSMVTLNPAKMLHIDNRVGSIALGKDADLVLWSAYPLSIDAKPMYTFVDGIAYFDFNRDLQMRREMAAERARLIQLMIEAKKAGKPTSKPMLKEARLYECESRGW